MKKESFLLMVLLLLENTALALCVRRWVAETAGTDPIYYAINLYKNSPAWYPWLMIAAGLTVALNFLPQRKKMISAMSPLLLAGGTLFLPANFAALIVDLLIVGWVIYRVLQIFPCRKIFPVGEWQGFLCAGLLSILLMLWTYLLQRQAYDTLFFAYQDWGEYAENYLFLADGKLPWKAFLARAGHFNLLPNLIMSALFRFFRAPETIFAVSAILLGSLPLLCHELARARRMPPGIRVGCAFLTAFSPVIVNQGLSLFYGYHPILFFGPLMLMFFIFRARKKRAGMAAMVILSLFVQETTAFFWAGYALSLFMGKQRLKGILFFAGSVLWFILIGRIVMPWALGFGDYSQNFHYANLGNSFMEILMSPLLRPTAFWRNVCQQQSLGFLMTLLLPLLPLSGLSWKKWITVLPLFLGIVMQNSRDLKNPSMWYGYEISIFLLSVMIPEYPLSGEKLKRLMLTSFSLTLCALFFWGRAPIGKYSARPIFERPAGKEVLDFIQKNLPPQGRLITTGRLRVHWMFHRETAKLGTEFRPDDLVVLDFNEILEPCREVRKKLLADPRAAAVASQNWFGRQYMIWRILPPGSKHAPLPFIYEIPRAEFERIGIPMRQENGDFSVRMTLTPRKTPLLLLRKNKNVEYDLEIVLKLLSQGKEFEEKILYGLGVHPAWVGKPGEIFALELPIPIPERGTVTLFPIKP